MPKTIGQVEAELTKAIIRFEKEYLGRGPRDARTYIIEDMIFIRLQGILTRRSKNWLKIRTAGCLLKKRDDNCLNRHGRYLKRSCARSQRLN